MSDQELSNNQENIESDGSVYEKRGTLPCSPKVNKTIPYFIKQLKVCFMMFRNYSYIVVDKSSRQATIVDPSWEYETIASAIDSLDVTLTTILLTHSHLDHINSVKPLIKRYPAEVYMSAKEIDFYGFRCARLNAIQHQDVVALGQTSITCILTPGHTAGGMCYLVPDVLFTGDTIFSEGCGICNAPGGNPGKMFESFQMIKKTIDPDVRVYPAHSFGKEPGQPLRSLAKDNIYFQIDQKEHFIAWRMRNNFSGAFNFK
jgi:hydroxyacylglutathione hydrolase